MAESSRKRRTSIGVLFWIAFILLVLVIFLANRSNIEQVLESTGIVEVVRDRFGNDGLQNGDEPAATDGGGSGSGSGGAIAPNEDSSNETGASGAGNDRPAATENDPAGEPSVVLEEQPTRQTQRDPDSSTTDDGTTVPVQEEPAREPQTETTTDPSARTGVAQREPSPDPAKPNRMMTGLYFIRVTEDGRTFPQRVVRPVYYASSPLTETIRVLIAGPSGEELDDGLLNLIPDGTQLISAHVTGGTAYLNFNQSFRFNPLGAEGTVAQLLQVIYSSTEFPTVERVQFLVEGEQVDYLGGDGIFVGEPLGRDAFSS